MIACCQTNVSYFSGCLGRLCRKTFPSSCGRYFLCLSEEYRTKSKSTGIHPNYNGPASFLIQRFSKFGQELSRLVECRVSSRHSHYATSLKKIPHFPDSRVKKSSLGSFLLLLPRLDMFIPRGLNSVSSSTQHSSSLLIEKGSVARCIKVEPAGL